MLNLDMFPVETTWTITDNCTNSEILNGGSYEHRYDTLTEKTFYLLEPSLYTLTIDDSGGDGICCGFGAGNFTVTDRSGSELANGGDFGSGTTINFGKQCSSEAP